MNIPNLLTIIRLILVPVYLLVFAFSGEQKVAAALIFIIASITDVLDGFIARKFNMMTKEGQLLDPLADKLMQIAVVVSMLFADMVPLWFVLVLACKEILMILGGFILYKQKTYVKSNVFGKVNTIVVFCAMVCLLLFSDSNAQLKEIMLGVAVGTNATAIISYTSIYFNPKKNVQETIQK